MRARLNSKAWRWLRPLTGGVILAVIVWRLGAGPFIDGLRAINGWVVVAAVFITALTTLCSAWRWTLVSRGLGVDIPLRTAVVSYYRSQFLNTTLPGGVVGDVHRGVRHGGDNGATSRSLRAVAWERTAGQLVLAGLAVLAVVALPSPLRSYLPGAVAVLVAVGALVLVAMALLRTSRLSSWYAVMRDDVRNGVFAQPNRGGVLVASLLVAAGYCSIFLLAAHAVGVSASTTALLPIALFVLIAMAVPTNIGGWGPREGAAAWVFAEAGLGAAQGVATAAVYGVLTVIACLPGALVLVADRFTVRAERQPAHVAADSAPVFTPEGAAHG